MRAMSLSPSRTSINTQASLLSSDQIRMDATAASFSSQVSNPVLLGSLLLGGQAFQLGRMAGSRLAGFLPGFSAITELTSFATGIACETSVFRASQNLFSGQSHSPVFSSGWFSTALDLSLFKGFASLTAGSHLLTRHLAQDVAVVTSRRLCQSLGLETEALSGNLIRDLANAEAMNLAMGVASQLGQFALGGRAARLERNLQAQISISRFNLHATSAQVFSPQSTFTASSHLRRLAVGALTLVGCGENVVMKNGVLVTSKVSTYPIADYIGQAFISALVLGLVFHVVRSVHRARNAFREGRIDNVWRGFFLEVGGDGIEDFNRRNNLSYLINPTLPNLSKMNALHLIIRGHLHNRSEPFFHDDLVNIKHDLRLLQIPASELARVARLPVELPPHRLGESFLFNEGRWATRLMDITWAWRILHFQTNTLHFNAANRAHQVMMESRIPGFFVKGIITGLYEGVPLSPETRVALLRALYYLVQSQHPDADSAFNTVRTEVQDPEILQLISNPKQLMERNTPEAD